MPASPAPTAAPLAGVPGEVGVAKPDPILVVDDLRKTFGGIVAVDVDHLEIQRGVITALIGPNGAGKTTFFNVLTGFDDPDSGSTLFDGGKIDRTSPHKLARRGMVRTFQLTKSLTKLSVIENMKLGARHQRGESLWRSTFGWLWRDQEREIEAKADALLARFRLDHMRDEYAGTLSGGQRKLLEMARALMSEPDLIMLDEPMAGVNPALTQSLLDHVKDLRAQGISVVFVEHDMDVVRDISDWVVVMAEGAVIAEGSHDAITANAAVIDAYLGAHHDAELDVTADLDGRRPKGRPAEPASGLAEAPTPPDTAGVDEQPDEPVEEPPVDGTEPSLPPEPAPTDGAAQEAPPDEPQTDEPGPDEERPPREPDGGPA